MTSTTSAGDRRALDAEPRPNAFPRGAPGRRHRENEATETRDHMTTDREQAMDAALDYLTSCTRDGIDWVELLRMRAAGADTTEIDEWVRKHRSAGDAPDQETSDQ